MGIPLVIVICSYALLIILACTGKLASLYCHFPFYYVAWPLGAIAVIVTLLYLIFMLVLYNWDE